MTTSFVAILMLLLTPGIFGEIRARSTLSHIGAQEISVGNLTSNVRTWRKDMAVMFYAPWCKYCKQLKPSWDQIAKVSKEGGKSLEVGTFDCETETSSTDLCRALGVDRYPSIYFIGYGDFNQGRQGNLLQKTELPRVVKYTADLYPDRIYDWMLMLNKISIIQRGVDNLKGTFTMKHGIHARVVELEEEVVKSDYKMRLYADELERYKADELFQGLSDHGDPFPLLAKIDASDEKTLPFRVCIVEYANEYCNVHKEERYCMTYKKHCSKTNSEAMVPAICRPEKCPLPALGCRVLSSCLNTDTIAKYQKALSERASTKA